MATKTATALASTMLGPLTAPAPSGTARDNIPSPPSLPLIGSLVDSQADTQMYLLRQLAQQYGPIFRYTTGSEVRIVVNTVELMDELSDETRFWKKPLSELDAMRPGPKGLFVAHSEDTADWQLAHRVLLPAFGPINVQSMFDDMVDLASQLLLRWARLGPAHRIPAAADFTSLTLDTIALCAMGYRFNSFYREEPHPFVRAMVDSLAFVSESWKIDVRMRRLLPWDDSFARAKADSMYLRTVGREVLEERRSNPTKKPDLLNTMLEGRDPKTGESMPDGLICANMVTFLIAGHETTSGLLAFAMLELLRSPDAYTSLQREVDHVVGRSKLAVGHLKNLKYANAVLRETLRLYPTAPGYYRGIRSSNKNDYEDLLGGKFAIHRDDRVLVDLGSIHRDPKVYGEDANVFRPERMLDEEFDKRPASAWKPFGTGVRACIGRAFAWQEALICLALMFQNFNFSHDDPSYEMRIRQTLTIKPEGFFMRARLRDGITVEALPSLLSGTSASSATAPSAERAPQEEDDESSGGKRREPMSIFYGGNTGTCQYLAQRLATESHRRGYHPTVQNLDEAMDALPRDRPIVVITASYEGQPPDNAERFVSWLQKLPEEQERKLDGVRYAVFGCGHSDWVRTFQRIPTTVDEALERHGATRLTARGVANAAEDDMLAAFSAWCHTRLWPALGVADDEDGTEHASPAAASFSASAGLEVEVQTHDRARFMWPHVRSAVVDSAYVLTAPGEPEKRHLSLRLAPDVTYATGDYLAVLPLNPSDAARAVLSHFRIPEHASLTVAARTVTFLPVGELVPALDLLRGYLELRSPATSEDIRLCIDACSDPSARSALSSLPAGPSPGPSLFSLLTSYPSISLAFSSFLSRLPPLRARYFSISSSPLAAEPSLCSLTYNVRGHLGVAGQYLASLAPGDPVLVSVRATNRFFRPPPAPESTPVIFLAAGSGLAPFRAFLQDRSLLRSRGLSLAPALVFFGCRAPDADRIYASELDAWHAAGVADIRYAFSRAPADSLGCSRVQDRFFRDRAEVVELWKRGARVYTCCASEAARAIRDVAKNILREEDGGLSEEELESWIRDRRNERIFVDSFD